MSATSRSRLVIAEAALSFPAMLSDRPHLRGELPSAGTAVSTWLVVALSGVFALQLLLGSGWLFGPVSPANSFGIRPDDFEVESAWKLATFWLLHSPGNLLHLAVVVAGISFAASGLQRTVNTAHVVTVFLAANLVGALGWLACRQDSAELLIGSAAGAFGLMSLFASHYPAREYRVLFLFLLPATIRPKQLVVWLLAVDLAALLVVDLLGRPLPFDYAAPSHLGGALVGWCYYRFVLARFAGPRTAGPTGRAAEPVSVKSGIPLSASAAEVTPALVRSDNIRECVDGILDKINAQGFASLTAAERRLLAEARNRFGPSR